MDLPAAIEPAISLRVGLARTLCRSWVRAGARLDSEEDAWLAMGLEGRFAEKYTAAAFGSSEAVHSAARTRQQLCAASALHAAGRAGGGGAAAAEALVPGVEELERWGGGLHEEQRWSWLRLLKAPWVLINY